MTGKTSGLFAIALLWGLTACASGEGPCPAAPPAPRLEVAPAAATPASTAPVPPDRPALLHWRDGAVKRAIVEFVSATTDPKSERYLEPAARIAVFDNDGTLWSEQPIYFQFAFALDRVGDLLAATPAPAWSKKPWAVKLKTEGKQAAASFDQKAWIEIFALSEAEQTSEEYQKAVRVWLDGARHPRWNRPYTELTFLPMLELLEYLRENDFKTFIVSGGSIWFMRVFAERVYGIPPEQVVGTSLVTRYVVEGGRGTVRSSTDVALIDDGPGKPVGIDSRIGRTPVLVVGNSDGDREMLEYATTRSSNALGLIVHHDDATREWAYDRQAKVGKLDRALDQAPSAGWLVVSMKDDFETIFAASAAGNP
jgi:phosphoglycolate phosphatase-like HAD superfamily hydrolase